jgi:hypothetical protein
LPKDAKRLHLGVAAGLIAFYNYKGAYLIAKQSIFFQTILPA